eukprot:g3550.t1
MNNTNATSAVALIDETACLQEFYPCSLTWSGNLFLLLAYGLILAWGAKQINLGSDKLLEVFPPGLIGGVLLPVLGALPDATVIFFSVINASGAAAQEQLNVGMGTLAGSNIILLTMPWAIALIVGRVPLMVTKSGRKKAKYHHPHSKKQRARRKTIVKKIVESNMDSVKTMKKGGKRVSEQERKEKDLQAFQKREALKALFKAIDSNNNGTIEKKEFMKALVKQDVIELIKSYEHLKNLLHPKSFGESFLKMNTSSDKHVTLDEFLTYAMDDIVDKKDNDKNALPKSPIINDLNDGSSTSSDSSSDSASSTSSEDEVNMTEEIDVAKEMTKRELTMRGMADILKRKDQLASDNSSLPLTSCSTWVNSGITVFVSVKRTSLIMLCTMLPFVVVQLFATLQYLRISDELATQVAGLVGFVICILIFGLYSWDAMHNDKQKKAILRRAQKKREWLSFLDTVKRANNHGGLDSVISSQFKTQVAKEYEMQIRMLFKENRRQNRLNAARRHRFSLKGRNSSNISRMGLQPKDYALKKLELTETSYGKNRNSSNHQPLQSISEGNEEEQQDSTNQIVGEQIESKAVAISIAEGDQNEQSRHSHRILGRLHSNDHGSSHSIDRSSPALGSYGSAQTMRSFAHVADSEVRGRHRSQSAHGLISALSVSSLPAVTSKRLPHISALVRSNIHRNLLKIREMREMTDQLKKNMDPHAYDEMRMALMGWAHKKSHMKAIFDAWKAAVENLNDEENASNDEIKNTRAIMLNGFGLILLGTVVIMSFADPLVNTIGRFGKNINVSSFFISMIAVPIASNASEFISSVLFARRKRKKELSLIFNMLYGGVVMNNALCLGVFLLLLYVKGLVWRFGSETLSLLIVAISIGLYGSCNRTYSSYMALVIGSMFPISVALVIMFRSLLPGF